MSNENGVPEIKEDADGGSAIKLEAYKRPNGTMFLRVSLRSIMKPRVWSNLQIDMSESNLRARVGITAGALAEHQSEQFGDPHDPSLCVATALRAYDRLAREQGW